MLAYHLDPILAIATAPGRGSVGIVRISGRSIEALVLALCGKPLRPREATYLTFPDGAGEPIDQGLALFFPAPHSYTGEDVLELQAHGGPVVLELLLKRCLELSSQPNPLTGTPLLSGLRLAHAGEFTHRAFLNDQIDLAQAEAVADLIDASTEAAARCASQTLKGVFSQKVEALSAAIVRLRMLVEATLDFPEEEIDFLQQSDALGQMARLQAGIREVLAQASQGALLREGIRVVIAGQPNAGKSSLLNALAGAELAIVTPVAGTTRDKVQETIQIEGVPVHVIDTAGLRQTDELVERIGVERTWQAIFTADVVLFLHDLSRATATEYIAADADIASAIKQKLSKSVPVIDVWNKSDLATIVPDHGIVLSTKTGFGLSSVRQALLAHAGWQAQSGGVFIARQRHIEGLKAAQQHLDTATRHLNGHSLTLELVAEELRLAHNALGEITGEFTTEDLLGAIFSKFCIGK